MNLIETGKRLVTEKMHIVLKYMLCYLSYSCAVLLLTVQMLLFTVLLSVNVSRLGKILFESCT